MINGKHKYKHNYCITSTAEENGIFHKSEENLQLLIIEIYVTETLKFCIRRQQAPRHCDSKVCLKLPCDTGTCVRREGVWTRI